MPAKKSSRPGLLSRGRPPTVTRPTASLSSKTTRKLIRSHHQLHKARAQALENGNHELVRNLDERIAANGGLENYQLASKKGQSRDRGGDSSKILVEWLDPSLQHLKGTTDGRLRLLEVGALSTQNACSRVKAIDVTRIDLNAQEPGILRQDFLERPVPTADDEKFHIISLSLVLNYVPSPAARGEMLQRTTEFLTASQLRQDNDILPCLFLVLPAACVLNSRYFTEERLQTIMSCIGYTMKKRKVTAKLIFYLWKFQGNPRTEGKVEFRKEILNDGRSRNNFTVTLDEPE